MNKEILVSVDHVSRYYGDECAVNDVSFSVHRGEVLGFLGPLQSCPTLCDPIDGSPPGSPVPGILQARTLE